MGTWTNMRSSTAIAVNPHSSVLGRENAILSGSGTDYYVPDFEGSLSIKSVVAGSAVWEAGGRRFTVHENCYLILNDRQRYTITIDSARPVTTFCVFFRRGFVEDVFRTAVTDPVALLDCPNAEMLQLGFVEKLETANSPVLGLIRGLREKIVTGIDTAAAFEDNFVAIAGAMIDEHNDAAARTARLPAARASTRNELYRRILRGRDHLLGSLDQPVHLADAARAACLSPYHFHREFRRMFGETPHRYLTRQRLERARLLLSRDNQTVLEVCLASGFESPASFSLLFRRHFGLAPSQFRQSALNSKNR
ncbi:MAG TPA: AraC family transcriptional regulator [Blastocatellia bacterium]